MSENYETHRRQAIIENLSTEHVIVAEPQHDYRAPLQGFLVTSVLGDSVLLSMLNLPRNAVYEGGARLEQYLNESRTTGDMMLARSTLEDAFTLNEDMMLAIGDTLYTYHIYDIFSVGIPVIAKGTSVSTRRSSGGKCEKSIAMTLSYRPAQITGIQTIEGQITWTNTFPLVIEMPEDGNVAFFQISATHPCEVEVFVSEIQVLATDGKQYTYVLEGTEGMMKVSRKY